VYDQDDELELAQEKKEDGRQARARVTRPGPSPPIGPVAPVAWVQPPTFRFLRPAHPAKLVPIVSGCVLVGALRPAEAAMDGAPARNTPSCRQ
jgi:hypothetical protein